MGRISSSAFGVLFVSLATLLLVLHPAHAQDHSGLAATLEVLQAGVEVLRTETSNWIAVSRESIVGTGDTIRTDESGRARITFFADGTSTELLPNTEYRITEFRGGDTSFTLVLEIVIGQTVQTLGRLLDTSSEYQMITPAMSLSARGTRFTVRVEETGRAAMLVSEGIVDASADGTTAQVPPAFGIRADAGGELSDVVPASTFDELDSALDGCAAVVNMVDDVSYNVRAEPNSNAVAIAMLPAAEIDRVFGVAETSGWYLVEADGQRGWIRASSVTIDDACAGVRVFPDNGVSEAPPVSQSRQPDGV